MRPSPTRGCLCMGAAHRILMSPVAARLYPLCPSRGKSTKHTPRRGHERPSWVCDAPPALLLLVLHVTPIGGVLPRKKGLEGRLNLLLKDRTLLIRLHGVERLP